MAIINKSTNNKYWRRCGERGTRLHCCWEYRLVQPLWKVVWRYLKKLKMNLPFDPVIPLLGIYLKEPKILIWKNICTLCSWHSILYHSEDLEAAQVPISRWVDKTTMGYLHNRILLSHKKENFTICDGMDGPQAHYTEWNEPVRERQIPYDFTPLWNLMNKQN